MIRGHVGISVVRATAQCEEREGEQPRRHVNKKICSRSTHLVDIDNWNSQHNKNSSALIPVDTKQQQIL